MKIDTISTFPHMFDSVMGESMMKRAQEKGVLQFHAHDLRDYTYDRHRTTDDYPFGGGHGLVMKCEPLYEAVEDVLGIDGNILDQPRQEGTAVILLAPHGRRFDDTYANELATLDHLVFVCGHYEGIDERVYAIADEVISLGDYVLTSGELAAMVVIDAVVRKLPGVLGAEDGALMESFADGLLEHPQYTRPAEFRGMAVPEVLLSGHHANIAAWQREQSLLRTKQLRPDLIESMLNGNAGGPSLSESDIAFLDLSTESGNSTD